MNLIKCVLLSIVLMISMIANVSAADMKYGHNLINKLHDVSNLCIYEIRIWKTTNAENCKSFYVRVKIFDKFDSDSTVEEWTDYLSNKVDISVSEEILNKLTGINNNIEIINAAQ